MRVSPPRDLKLIWEEGVVDRSDDHVEIRYGERQKPVALVARDSQKRFTVQFLMKARANDMRARQILSEVRGDLTHYLFGLVGPDSWAFVQFHCNTAANLSSRIRWSWHPRRASN